MLAEQSRLRDELERNPTDFLERTFARRMTAARARVAEFLHADPDGVVYVPNTTTGVASVLASLDLQPGDEVVTPTFAYVGVRTGLRVLAERTGIVVTAVDLPLPGSPAEDLAGPLLAAVGPRTRAVVVDAITSSTALCLPVEEIVRGCRERDVTCVVDAAHAPGHVDVDLSALDPDAWVGNLHKWAGAPKGTAVLYVGPRLRGRVHPFVRSHGTGSGLHAEFDWTGTYDPTGWLAAPVALDLLGGLGWDRLRRYSRELARWGATAVAAAAGRPLPVGDLDRHAGMAIVDVGPLTHEQGVTLRERLWAEHRIAVPVSEWGERRFVRLSAFAYNDPAEYARLAAVLPGLVPD